MNNGIPSKMYDNKFDQFNLLRSDLQILSAHISSFIQQLKTDVYRHVAWILLSRTGGSLCPVHNLKLYLKLAEINADSSKLLFRNINKRKGKFVL